MPALAVLDQHDEFIFYSANFVLNTEYCVLSRETEKYPFYYL